MNSTSQPTQRQVNAPKPLPKLGQLDKIHRGHVLRPARGGGEVLGREGEGGGGKGEPQEGFAGRQVEPQPGVLLPVGLDVFRARE